MQFVRRCVRPLALASLLLPGAARAQAPVVTPAGDPSVRQDLEAWLRAVAADDVPYIVIDSGQPAS